MTMTDLIEAVRHWQEHRHGADADNGSPAAMRYDEACERLDAALSALSAQPQPLSAEDRFEQFVQAEIARSPEPLRELGEYLGRVLDEDQFPAANRLLLQLATLTPKASAPAGVEGKLAAWLRDLAGVCSELRPVGAWPGEKAAARLRKAAAALEAAREDAARLDWLGSGEDRTCYVGMDDRWTVQDGPSMVGGDTLRAAIDAAMEATGGDS